MDNKNNGKGQAEALYGGARLPERKGSSTAPDTSDISYLEALLAGEEQDFGEARFLAPEVGRV